MKTIAGTLITEKNKLAMASVWLPLVSVDIDAATTLHLVPNPTAITFGGVTYVPFGLQLDLVETDSRGSLNDVQISISNISRQIGAYLESTDLRGNRVRVLWINSSDLTDSVLDESYEITAYVVTEQVVTFTLGHERLLQQVFPNGRFFRDNCRHIYKDTACGYTGTLATCDKILEGTNGCRAHANQARFGAFPAIPSVAGRTR